MARRINIAKSTFNLKKLEKDFKKSNKTKFNMSQNAWRINPFLKFNKKFKNK